MTIFLKAGRPVNSGEKRITVPVLCGPTAGGKTALAVKLLGGGDFVAVSADSVQIYRGMDIGSAKATTEEQHLLPHLLIDIREPDQTYSAGDFFRDAVEAIESIREAGGKPLVLGGSGLYLKTLISGFFEGPRADQQLREQLKREEAAAPGTLYQRLSKEDPVTAQRISPNDRRRIIRALEVLILTGRSITQLQQEQTIRPPYNFRIAGIIHDRKVLEERICRRIYTMLVGGLIEEVNSLMERGCTPAQPPMQSLGYKHVFEYLCGTVDLDQCRETLTSDTVAFARRQIMLFKRIPGLTWINGSDSAAFRRYLVDFIDRMRA